MIIIPQSFLFDELKKSIFSEEDLKKALKKVEKGIGISLGSFGVESGILKKLSFTTPSGHARMVSVIQTKSGHIIPILLRDKKDKVGANMSLQNTYFKSAFLKSYEKIFDDIDKNRFEILL